jgi:anti-anti-sigma factor
LLSPPDLDAIEGELVNLTACGGQRIILDLGGISGIANRLLAILERVHRAYVVAGGRLQLCGLCPELASVVVSAGMDQVLEILPNEDSAFGGARPATSALRPPPLVSREKMVSLTAKGSQVHSDRVARKAALGKERARRRATALDATVCGWLTPRDESMVDSPAVEDERRSGPPGPLETVLRDRSLAYRFLLDVLVLDPHPRRMYGDLAMGPIRRVLTAVRDQKTSRRVVIDLSHVASLSAEGAATLADQAIKLAVSGGTLRLSQVRPAVLESIRQSRLNRVAKIYPDVEEAVLARWD